MKDRNLFGFILHPSSFILPIIFFLLALAPRLLAPGEFVTVDEAYHWFERVEHFLDYVQQGDYASTNIVGHPGVTTMWLGASGLLAHQHLSPAGWIPPADSDPLLYRTFLRAPIAIVSSLCVGLAYPLLRRLYGGRVTLLATLLWAGEPFLIAHAKLLHLDSLVTSFVAVSLLAALVATHHDSYAQVVRDPEDLNRKERKERKDKTVAQRDGHDYVRASGMSISGWLVLSALAGGLAFLTKSPAFILVPMVGIVLLLPVLDAYWNRKDSRHVCLRQSAVRLLVWGVLAALVWAACWPAVWVDLPGVFHRMFSQAVNDGGAPHGWGNFFMGKAVDDPGPLFYPVVLAFRLAPWTLIGCVFAALLPFWSYWDGISRKGTKTQRLDKGLGNLHSFSPAHGVKSIECIQDTRTASLLVPLLFVLLFLTAMSILPKKFDRYALPVFPMLDLIAAWGLIRACDLVCHRSKLDTVRRGAGATTRRRDDATTRRDDGATRRRGDETTRRRDDETMARRNDGATRRRGDETTQLKTARRDDATTQLKTARRDDGATVRREAGATVRRCDEKPARRDDGATRSHQFVASSHRIAAGGLFVLIAATLFWYHPYEISYYNPLLGGGATAPSVLPVGWGEGYEQAGEFISRQPDGCERAVATWFIPVFRFAYDCPPWLISLDEAREPGAAQYVVLYIDQLQRNNEPEATAMIQHNYTPIHTVRIHGIPYASIYKLPLPNEHTVQADFGDAIRLIGYDIGTDAVQTSGTFTLTLQWEPRAPITPDYNLFVHVLDGDGNLISQIDVPPGGPQMPTSSWLVHGFLSWHHPVPLPADRLADTRWLSIGIYDPNTFTRLPVRSTTPQPADAPDDGPDTLVIEFAPGM